METGLQIRTVNEATLLEACIENMTKGPLVLDHIKFDAALGLSAEPVSPLPDAPGGDPLEDYIQGLQVSPLSLSRLFGTRLTEHLSIIVRSSP